MTEKSEALRLADRLEHGRGDDVIYAKPAAAELRRLHDLNGELLEALKFYGSSCDATESTPCGYEGNLCCKRARAAIAKAEGQA
jgi:hypothetical protein